MTASSLDALFAPSSVAVIGASDDPARIGGRPLRYLQRGGFAGAVYPINPNRDSVQGIKAWPDVASIPFTVDLAIIALPADQAVQAIRACAARSVNAVILFSAGFAEVGPEGAAMQREIAAIARQSGMRVLGPNCLGVFNTRLGFYGTFAQAFDAAAPQDGPVAIASQSGACGSHLGYLLRQRRVGVNYWITTGNEVDVEVSEALLWLAQAPQVKVIVAYVEAIREGATFIRALAAARANRKPVVMIKVGRSSAGALAAASHTGALVGQDDVYDAVLREYGVHRADSIAELVEIACACARGVLPADRSIGILTLSGGLGVQAADAAERNGLDVRPLAAHGQAKIKSLISFAGTGNPIDITAQATNEATLTGRCIDIALTDGGYQSLVCLLSTIPAAPRFADPILASMVELRARFPDRLIVLAFASPPEVVQRFEDAGFPVFEDQDAAIRTIAALVGFGERFAAVRQATPLPLAQAPQSLPAVLDEHAAKGILARAGIPVLQDYLVADGAAARRAAAAIDAAVALKIVSPDIAHKTEIGGVVLGVRTPEAAERETTALLQRVAQRAPGARISGVLVSPMLSHGVEAICGSFTDPVFGPVVMFGLGGIHVEVMRDVAYQLAPFGESEALAMIGRIRGHKLLRGMRGAPPSDLAALARALSQLSQLAASHRNTVAEIDINPFVVLPQGQGGYALDALIVPHSNPQETPK